jgi:hypothetical protein
VPCSSVDGSEELTLDHPYRARTSPSKVWVGFARQGELRFEPLQLDR